MDHESTEYLARTIDEELSSSADKASQSGVSVYLSPETLLKGRYKVGKKLGEGGMGVVYHAEDTELKQAIAIKVLKNVTSANPEAVKKLKKEALVAMKLSHPGILRLINFEQDGDCAFLLMEYVKGRPLCDVLLATANKTIPPEAVAKIGMKTAEALAYAHMMHVIHRDIKPSNLMLTDNGEVTLMDFGIARALFEGDETRPVIAGTLSYIAPEIFRGEQPDPRADIYALGLSMYEFLSGKTAVRGSSAKEIIDQHLDGGFAVIEGVDPILMNIIFQAIEKQPNARYQSATEMAVALARYLGIDDGAKLDRQRKMMEYDKRKIKRQLEDIEREKKKLKTESRRQNNRYSSSSTHDLTSAKNATGATTGSFVTLVLAALLAGLAADLTTALLLSFDMISFSQEKTLSRIALMLSMAIIVGGPTGFFYGLKNGITAFVIALIAGIFAYSAGSVVSDYAFEAELWSLYDLVPIITIGLPSAIGISICFALFEEDRKNRMESFLPTFLALMILLLLAENDLPEQFVNVENSDYLYLPLISIFCWLSIKIWKNKR